MTGPVTPALNQCDGCRRGLPLNEHGNHYNPDGSYDRIGCTADRYAAPARADAAATPGAQATDDPLAPLTGRWDIQYTRATRTDGPAWTLAWRRVYGGVLSDERVVGPAPTLAECVADAVEWEAENDRREPAHSRDPLPSQRAGKPADATAPTPAAALAKTEASSSCGACSAMREALADLLPRLSCEVFGRKSCAVRAEEAEPGHCCCPTCLAWNRARALSSGVLR